MGCHLEVQGHLLLEVRSGMEHLVVHCLLGVLIHQVDHCLRLLVVLEVDLDGLDQVVRCLLGSLIRREVLILLLEVLRDKMMTRKVRLGYLRGNLAWCSNHLLVLELLPFLG